MVLVRTKKMGGKTNSFHNYGRLATWCCYEFMNLLIPTTTAV